MDRTELHRKVSVAVSEISVLLVVIRHRLVSDIAIFVLKRDVKLQLTVIRQPHKGGHEGTES